MDNKDIIIKGMLCDEQVNFVAISGKKLVETARKTHELSRTCTAALGRTLLMTSMMSAQLKNETDSITNIIKGEGLAGNIVCAGRPHGIVKGYIENPSVELPPMPNGKIDVASAVGWFGDLTVIKDLSLKEPYIGKCNMVSGEIAEDFANYFTVSEQQPSLVYLGVHVEAQSGNVLSSGGILIQPLPGCPDEVLDKLDAKVNQIKELAKMLESKDLEECLNDIFSDIGIEVTQTIEPMFKCDCSRERLERVLISLGIDELEEMKEKEHGAELKCHFCNTKYNFDEGDLEKLIDECKK